MGYGFTSSVHHGHSLEDSRHLVGILPLLEEGNLEEVGRMGVAHWRMGREEEEGSRVGRDHRSDREGEVGGSLPWDDEGEIDSEHGHRNNRDAGYGRGSRTRLGGGCILEEGRDDRNRPWEGGTGVVQESVIGRAREEACRAESATSSQLPNSHNKTGLPCHTSATQWTRCFLNSCPSSFSTAVLRSAAVSNSTNLNNVNQRHQQEDG